MRKVYGETVAVDSLNMTVNIGEIFGLLGPNGAGKTTTGGMLTTRVFPTSGRAFIGDIDVAAHPAEAKTQIGVVPQTNTLDRSLSVEQNLYFHGRYFGMSKKASWERTVLLLDQFKLQDKAQMQVISLSGGMAQRLMIARAIMHDPTVLVLDEPTSGLDPQSRLALWDIMRNLNAHGQSVLLTTHYMEEADELCERIAVMDHGKILALGTPDELKKSLGGDSSMVVKVSRGEDQLHKQLALEFSHDPLVVTQIEEGIKITGKNVAGTVAEVVGTAEKLGAKVYDISIMEPSLETVFINLTGRELRD